MQNSCVCQKKMNERGDVYCRQKHGHQGVKACERGRQKKPIIYRELQARHETLGPLFHAGTLLDLSLCGSYVCKLTVSVSCICTLTLLYLDGAVSLKIVARTLFLLSHVDPCALRGGIDGDIPFRAEHTNVSSSLSTVRPAVTLCVNYHPLQEEVSLMRVER